MVTLRLYNAELYPEDLHLFVEPEAGDGLEELPYRLAADRNRISYFFQPHKIGELYLVATRFHGQNRLVIAELSLGNGPAGIRATGVREYRDRPDTARSERICHPG
jgi:hypothetical protein